MAARLGDEVIDGPHVEFGRRRSAPSACRRDGRPGEIPGRIEGERAIDPGRDGHLRRRGHQQRVAVAARPWRPTPRRSSPAAPPRLSITIVLAERPPGMVGGQARQHVDRAAGGEGHDERDRPHWKIRRRAHAERRSDAPSRRSSVRRPIIASSSGHGQDDLARRLAREQRVHRVGRPSPAGSAWRCAASACPRRYQASISSKFLRASSGSRPRQAP